MSFTEDFLKNPFAATYGAYDRRLGRQKKEAERAKERDEHYARMDQLSATDFDRNMAFHGAQHMQTMERLSSEQSHQLGMTTEQGRQARLNMGAARKHGLSNFNQTMGADGSHGTSFSLQDMARQIVEDVATKPPAGAAIKDVAKVADTPTPVDNARAPQNVAEAALQAATGKVKTGGSLGKGLGDLFQETGAVEKPEKEVRAPGAHSGSKTKGSKQYKLF